MIRKMAVILMTVISVSAVGVTGVSAADPEAVTWDKTYGSPGNDFGQSVQQTSDGGYIVVGVMEPHAGGEDSANVWLIKTDSGGNELWTQTFGGPEPDSGWSVQQTSDGGYIIAGRTTSYGDGEQAMWLIKTDADGGELWNKTFGDRGYASAYSVQQTSDGGYILVGTVHPGLSGESDVADVRVVKTDADGNEQWQQTLGGPEYDESFSIQQTSDGGYILAGFTASFGVDDADGWLIRLDADGNELWNKTVGGVGDDSARSIQQTSDGGYIIAGVTRPQGTNRYSDWLIKTDTDGNELWSKTFEGSVAYSVRQTSDGGYIAAGAITSETTAITDVWLIKTDSSGDELWSKIYSGGQGSDTGYSVQQTSDGGYIIAGSSYRAASGSSDVWLIKTDSDGEVTGLPAVPVAAEGSAGYPWVAFAAVVAVAAVVAFAVLRIRAIRRRSRQADGGDYDEPGFGE